MFRSAIQATQSIFDDRSIAAATGSPPRHVIQRAVFSGLIALAITFVASPAAQAQQGQLGYVDTTALNLRVDAGTKSAIVGILLKYDAVTVLSRKKAGSSTWYEIEASGGYTNGYVSARYIQFGNVPAGAREEENPDYGEKKTPTLSTSSFKYIGARACAECHEESTGEFPKGASTVWSHTVHSAAYQTLSKDYTIEIARRKRNIEDPINDWRCVKCHVTAFGAAPEQLADSYRQEDGVSCEVCHGPGSAYADVDHGPDNLNRGNLGFRILENLAERREVCTSCHNPASPTYIPFNLREFSRSIAHWVDPGDSFYYEDAIAEANRRQKRVDSSLAERASQLAQPNEAEIAAKAAREAEEAEKAASLAAEREEARKRREAEAATADAAKKAQLAREQAAADAKAAAEAKAAKEAAAAQEKAEAAERAAAAKELAAQEAAAKDAERKAAEAALAASAAAEADAAKAAAAARKKSEDQARAAASNATGVESYLEDVDDVIPMNIDGVKYLTVEFPHLAHASNQYLPNGKCNDCHHTHEGDDAPEACSSCHDIGGDADEEGKKKRAFHTKNKGFPREADQEETSCVGCHKSQNALLAAGQREGEKAPTKCTTCHKRKR